MLFGTKSKCPKIWESGLGVISGVNLARSRHVSRPQRPWLSLRDSDYVLARALWEPASAMVPRNSTSCHSLLRCAREC